MSILLNSFFLTLCSALGIFGIFGRNVRKNREKLMDYANRLHQLLGYTLLGLGVLSWDEEGQDIAVPRALDLEGFAEGWLTSSSLGKEFRDAFVGALKDYSQGLDDLVPFLRRYGRLIGAGDVLRSVQFHEMLYERLFSAKGLDPKALGLEGYFPGKSPLETPGLENSGVERSDSSDLSSGPGGTIMERSRLETLDLDGLQAFTIHPRIHQAILDKNVEYLKKTAQFLESLSPWEPLYQIGRSWGRFFLGIVWFWDKTKADKAKLGPGDKKVPGDCGLTKAEQKREEEVQAASGLLRITFTAQSIWNRIPFTTLFGLTVLLPVAYNVTDKYVMNRARFGRYLSDNIRLAYEDFYYTLKASKNVNPREIHDMADRFLNTINGYRQLIPDLHLGQYGRENQILIMRFIFALRTIALATLSYGHLPKNLPNPADIQDIAYAIQDFMEDYAWQSFLLPKSMNKIKISVPLVYLKLLQIIESDKELWSIFVQDCNKKCLEEVKALSK
jgi:hypothetical protein